MHSYDGQILETCIINYAMRACSVPPFGPVKVRFPSVLSRHVAWTNGFALAHNEADKRTANRYNICFDSIVWVCQLRTSWDASRQSAEGFSLFVSVSTTHISANTKHICFCPPHSASNFHWKLISHKSTSMKTKNWRKTAVDKGRTALKVLCNLMELRIIINEKWKVEGSESERERKTMAKNENCIPTTRMAGKFMPYYKIESRPRPSVSACVPCKRIENCMQIAFERDLLCVFRWHDMKKERGSESENQDSTWRIFIPHQLLLPDARSTAAFEFLLLLPSFRLFYFCELFCSAARSSFRHTHKHTNQTANCIYRSNCGIQCSAAATLQDQPVYLQDGSG